MARTYMVHQSISLDWVITHLEFFLGRPLHKRVTGLPGQA